MVARIRRDGQQFEIPDGTFRDFDSLNDVLKGHPNGIGLLKVGQQEVRILVENFGDMSDPVGIKQIRGQMGDLEISVSNENGRDLGIGIDIFNGSAIRLKSQGGEMEIYHVNEASKKS